MVIAAVTSHAAISSAGDPTVAAHVCRHDEDARPDHRAHHNRGRGEQPHPAHKVRRRCSAVAAPRRHSGRSSESLHLPLRSSHVPSVLPQKLKKVPCDLLDALARRSRPEITATESAPASITLRALARVMPPMATSGLVVSARARRTPSSPTTCSASALVPVANAGPIAM